MNPDKAELAEISEELLAKNVTRIKRLADLALNSSMLDGQDPRIASEYRRIIDSCFYINYYMKESSTP